MLFACLSACLFVCLFVFVFMYILYFLHAALFLLSWRINNIIIMQANGRTTEREGNAGHFLERRFCLQGSKSPTHTVLFKPRPKHETTVLGYR